METILPSQPAGYKQLIKTSFALYQSSFTRIVVMALLLSIITFTPRLISIVIGQDLYLNMPLLSPYRLWLLAIDMAALIFFVAILWRMHCVTRGVHEPLIEDFSVGVKKVFYVLVASIIQYSILLAYAAIIISLQIIMLKYQYLLMQSQLSFILALSFMLGQTALLTYVTILFVFFIPIIAIENKGVIAAFERSMHLSWNHWWSILTIQLTPWICYLIILGLMRNILNLDIHIYFLDQGPHNEWATLIHIIIFALFIPWVASLLLIQLNDIELRKKMVPTSK